MADRNLIEVPLDHLHDHPLNSHVVTKRERQKIANNIRRTGRYPALTVRLLETASEFYPGEDGHFQILDGHQRRLIFVDLVEEGHEQFSIVLCDDWSPITDDESLIALATLNSWGGNAPRRRAERLHAITKFTEMKDAAQILPENERQIRDAAKLLKQPVADIQRLIDEAEEPDEITISFVVGTDRKAAVARFTAAAQVFAVYYGATVTNIVINEGGDYGRVAVLTFQSRNTAQAIINEALKKAAADLPSGVKNKRGRALEDLASAYLGMCLEEESQVPLAKIEKERLKPPPKRKRRTKTPVVNATQQGATP